MRHISEVFLAVGIVRPSRVHAHFKLLAFGRRIPLINNGLAVRVQHIRVVVDDLVGAPTHAHVIAVIPVAIAGIFNNFIGLFARRRAVAAHDVKMAADRKSDKRRTVIDVLFTQAYAIVA